MSFNYEQWLRSNFAGWAEGLEDDFMEPEDCVGDMVGRILGFPAGDTKQAIAYLKATGVGDIEGRLTDDLFCIAYA